MIQVTISIVVVEFQDLLGRDLLLSMFYWLHNAPLASTPNTGLVTNIRYR